MKACASVCDLRDYGHIPALCPVGAWGEPGFPEVCIGGVLLPESFTSLAGIRLAPSVLIHASRAWA